MVGLRRKNIRWSQFNMADMELYKLIVQYAHSNKAEGQSPKTIDWYSEMLEGFNRFLKSRGLPELLSNFNIELVREFVVYEQERGMSPATVQCKVRALKAFSTWLNGEGYFDINFMSRLKLPKAPVKFIEPLTNVEIDRLVVYYNPLTAIGCRDIALLILLLDTGLRLNELSILPLQDAHIDEGYLKVMGKGSKERTVPVGALCQKMLWRYTVHFRPQPIVKANDNLFLTLEGDIIVCPKCDSDDVDYTEASGWGKCQSCGLGFQVKTVLIWNE